jgi:hypothetical protein
MRIHGGETRQLAVFFRRDSADYYRVRRIRRSLVMNNGEDMLRVLGYDERWLAWGFVSLQYLSQQFEAFESSGGQNTEHYRYGAFRHVLAQRASISDDDLERYIELASLDPDQAMAGSALADLVNWRGMTEAQLERLAEHSAFQIDFLQRLVRRRRLREAIEIGPIEAPLVEACLASGDSTVQRALVGARGVTPEYLAVLARAGCNRAVRNLARQRLTHPRRDPPN